MLALKNCRLAGWGEDDIYKDRPSKVLKEMLVRLAPKFLSACRHDCSKVTDFHAGGFLSLEPTPVGELPSIIKRITCK